MLHVALKAGMFPAVDPASALPDIAVFRDRQPALQPRATPVAAALRYGCQVRDSINLSAREAPLSPHDYDVSEGLIHRERHEQSKRRCLRPARKLLRRYGETTHPSRVTVERRRAWTFRPAVVMLEVPVQYSPQLGKRAPHDRSSYAPWVSAGKVPARRRGSASDRHPKVRSFWPRRGAPAERRSRLVAKQALRGIKRV